MEESIEVKVSRIDQRVLHVERVVEKIDVKIDDLSSFKMKVIGACILLPFVFSLILTFF